MAHYLQPAVNRQPGYRWGTRRASVCANAPALYFLGTFDDVQNPIYHDDLGGRTTMKVQTRQAQILKAYDYIFMVAKLERKPIERDGARRYQRSAYHGYVCRRGPGRYFLTGITLRAEVHTELALRVTYVKYAR